MTAADLASGPLHVSEILARLHASFVVPPLTPSLALAVGVFLLQSFGAWGLGDAIVHAVTPSRIGDSRLMGPTVALAVGFGVLGQCLFLAGLAGDAYQTPVLWSALGGLGLLAVFRLRGRQLSWRGRLRLPVGLGKQDWAVLLLTAGYVVLWAWVSLGFNPGSDVFTHHYLEVKYMLQVKHFAHSVHLPVGMAHVSAYNPALARMLYLPGYLLADERAANMFHWLTQVMLISGIYGFGRFLLSRRAGLLAVALYLTTGMMGYFPLETQDYSLTALYMVLAMHVAVLGTVNRSIRMMGLAGLLAGLMLSTKYYAVPMAGLMVVAVALWEPAAWTTWSRRLRLAVLFGIVAVVAFSPWLLYNIVTFHDPLFPASFQDEELRLFNAVEWIHNLSPFVVPSDRSFLEPTLFYYLSLFVPFESSKAYFGLSVMFLIAVPCSIYSLTRHRGAEWRPAHVLLGLSFLSFGALHILVGHAIFYKWAIFPAVFYSLSFGFLVERLRPCPARWLWGATLATACLTFVFVGAPRVLVYAPPAAEQSARWDEATRYINATVERGSVVTHPSAKGTYYLRADLVGMRDNSFASTDWTAEEALLRRVGIGYMLVDPSQEALYGRYYDRWSAVWRQLSPREPAVPDYIDDVHRRYGERNRRRADFLRMYGTVVKTFGDGTRLYKVSQTGNW